VPAKTTTHSAYRCERGSVRKDNQDAVFADDRNGVYIVADGMGGHNAGAMASQACVRLINQELKKNEKLFLEFPENKVTSVEISRFLEFCLQSASRDIFLSGEADEQLKGMGTTCSLVVIAGKKAFLAHVGDSRLYLLRNRKLYQVTDDHSVVNELLKRGQIATDKTADLPPEIIPVRNAITRAIGSEENVEIDTQEIDLEDGDRLLLCSDGFYRYYDLKTKVEQIRLLSPDLDISKTATVCLEFAERQGGEDNISVIVVDYNAKDPILHLQELEERELEIIEKSDLAASQSSTKKRGGAQSTERDHMESEQWGHITASVSCRPLPPIPPTVLERLTKIGISMTLSADAILSIDDALIYIKSGSIQDLHSNLVLTAGNFLGLAALRATTQNISVSPKKKSLKERVDTYKPMNAGSIKIIRCEGPIVRAEIEQHPTFGTELLQHVLGQLIRSDA